MHSDDDNALTTPEKVWDLTMNINVKVRSPRATWPYSGRRQAPHTNTTRRRGSYARSQGVWFGCKHAIPALRRAGGGSIINTASFVALLGAATPQLACTCALPLSRVLSASRP